jgi:CRISPR system Cascade subunit CasE
VFLSKLLPSVRHRLARRDLANAYELHRTLWSAFPDGEPGRVLFRVDVGRTGARPTILVQSDLEPDWSRLPDDGYLMAPPESKPFDPVFAAGQRLRFRLRANPTKRLREESVASDGSRVVNWHGRGVSKEGRPKGKRVGLYREEEQVRGLLRHAEAGGFRVPGEWSERDGREYPNFRVEVAPEGAVRCGKAGHDGGRLVAARFDGVLDVTDPARFRAAVGDGVGPGKGFGFGLLSLAPAGG